MESNIKSFVKSTFIFKLYLKRQCAKRSKRVAILKHYFLEENVEMLRNFSSALNEAGIPFWLEFGTLLGFYREHSFIAHDLDIDTGAYYEDVEEVQKALEKAGFKLVREYNVLNDGGKEQCYLYRHSTIDVFYFRKDGNKMFCNSFYETGKSQLTEKSCVNKSVPVCVARIEVPLMNYVPATFYGCDVYVPEDTDLYLRTHYGPDYMTPNPNYSHKKQSTNIIWYDYEEKQGEALFKLPFFGRPEEYGLI